MIQNAVDADQREKTNKIDSEITYLERAAKDIINNLAILKIRVDDLVDLDELKLTLATVRAKNDELEQAEEMLNSDLMSLVS